MWNLRRGEGDESLLRQLAAELTGHQVATVQSLGWSSMRNGELLRRAAAEGFAVFVTAGLGNAHPHCARDRRQQRHYHPFRVLSAVMWAMW